MARTKFRYGKDHMTEEHYADFFRDCEAHGWPDAMERLVGRDDIIKPKKIPEFLSNQKRNDFIFLLPIGPESAVLDYGSGWGNTSFTLSHYCGRIIAVEADRQRLRFSAAHFSHAQAENILPMAGGGATTLPFADNSFDAVILNGVLEWTATTIPGHPREVHLTLLKEIRRVLRPGGHVAISIENRYSYKWLTGIRDQHAGGLRWVSFLPRKLADLYSRIRLRRPYRTWFYSYHALIDLLQEAGLGDGSIYSYHPNHVTFTHLFRIDNDADARRMIRELRTVYKLAWRDRLVYALATAGVPYRWVAHDYLAVASKPVQSADTADAAIGEIRRVIKADVGPADILRSTARTILMEFADSSSRKMLKFPRTSRWNGNLRSESSLLAHYESLELTSTVAVPRIESEGTIFDRAFVLTTHVPGIPSIDRPTAQILDAGLRNWLIEVARNIRPVSAAAPETRWWRDASDQIGIGDRHPTFDARLAAWRGVCVHGDLSPNNILSHSGGLSIVDWEFGDPDGLPLIDLVDFLLYCRNRETRSYRKSWDALFGKPGDGAENDEILGYCNAIGLPQDLIPALLDQFLIKKIALLSSLDEPTSVRKRGELVEILTTRWR